MATTSIAAAIKAIPSKKEDLRKAFDALQSYTSSLASFTLQWKDLEDHFSSIERSIEARFKELESKSRSAAPLSAVEAEDNEPEAEPRPELKALCVQMDGKGLQSFIIANRKDLEAIQSELVRALRSAPDAAALVLDAMDGFYASKPKGEKDVSLPAIRRTCLNLLEKFHVVGSEIKPSVRERAKKLAVEWKGKISHSIENDVEVLAFLQLVMSFGLIMEFEVDELLDLLVIVSRRKQTVDLVRNLGLADSVPDLVQKLNNKGKQLVAVKFVYAFNLLDKFPPVPLLKAYLKESKKAAQELRKKGNFSNQSQHDAAAKDIAALRAVVKAVEEYKLEAEYPCENLQKRITQLEQQKADRKRTTTSASATNLKNQHQQPNKRPRPSVTTTSSISTAITHPYPSVIHSQSSLGLTNQASFLGLTGSYGLTTAGSHYDRAGPGISGISVVQGGNPIPPTSYLYSSESLARSGLFDRSMPSGGYSFPSYGSSRHP